MRGLRFDGRELVLSTGKKLDIGSPVIGLELSDLARRERSLDRITYGYDATLYTAREAAAEGEKVEPSYLSEAECREIAQFMVQAWAEYRDSISAGGSS
ncbi:hypothetical protein [Aquabacterium humicola]|uniref:hypothetical protein n=1 Tax=Aquabacterium humicola TaxID=3237377 RepID=UPI0025435F6F|nr:hypothetical protein [Rubrivivax pictus]